MTLDVTIGHTIHLPYATASFAMVTTHSFHDLPDPLAVLKEMDRVTKWGGHVAVIDATNERQSIVYNAMEQVGLKNVQTKSHPSGVIMVGEKQADPAYGISCCGN